MPVKKKIAKNEKSISKKKTPAVKSKLQSSKKSASVKKAVTKKVAPNKKNIGKKTLLKKKAEKVLKGKDVGKKSDTKGKVAPKKTESVKKAPVAKTNVKTGKVKSVSKKPDVIKKVPVKAKVESKKVDTIKKSEQKVKSTKPEISTKLPIQKKAKEIKKTAPKLKQVEEEVNDKVVKIPPKPKVRYSDGDLRMFHDRIVDMRKEAIEELRMLRERLEDLTNYDFAEESMIYSMHMAEQGSEAFEKEKTYAQIQRINEYIKKLDEALGRIKDKTFGICRVCGCLIAKERLLAVPITTLSASYKIQKKCPEDGIDRIEPLRNVQ